jgi:hypothetical protein
MEIRCQAFPRLVAAAAGEQTAEKFHQALICHLSGPKEDALMLLIRNQPDDQRDLGGAGRSLLDEFGDGLGNHNI